MKPFIAVVLAVILLASCTHRRYAHYTFVKREKIVIAQKQENNHAKQFNKATTFENRPVALQLSKGNNQGKFQPIILKPNTYRQKSNVSPKFAQNNQLRISPKIQEKLTTQAKDDPKKPEKKELNPHARKSLTFLLLAIFPYSWIVLVGPYFYVKAIQHAILALKEIDENPGKYRGEGMATTVLIISTLGVAATIFLLFIGISAILVATHVLTEPFFLAL